MEGRLILLSDMLSIQIIIWFCLFEVLAFSIIFWILLYFEFLNPQIIQYLSTPDTLPQLSAPLFRPGQGKEKKSRPFLSWQLVSGF